MQGGGGGVKGFGVSAWSSYTDFMEFRGQGVPLGFWGQGLRDSWCLQPTLLVGRADIKMTKPGNTLGFRV